MRLLILTQKVDIDDNNLGFFHRWIEEFAKRCESVVVICLQKGEYCLPSNVKVISLGKEKDASRIKYIWSFYKYIFKYKNDYNGVFVHMNKEYILLGGLLWKLWHKKIALWYTHKAVNWQLKLAEKMVDKIFTASKESFRFLSHKVEITGHGIDVGIFEAIAAGQTVSPKEELRLLSVGRISQIKDLKTVVRGIEVLCQLLLDKCVLPDYRVRLTVIGEPITSQDKEYQNELLQMKNKSGASWFINFMGPVPHAQMPLQYQHHHILIHTSQTGSVDKVVLEALASGRVVVTSSEAFHAAVVSGLVYAFPQGDSQKLAKTIEKIYNSGIILPNERGVEFVKKNHNLENIVVKISDFFKRP